MTVPGAVYVAVRIMEKGGPKKIHIDAPIRNPND